MPADDPHALQIILATTFLDSLENLEKDEQLRALSFVQELRRSTKSTGASLERVRNAKSKNLWSGRIDRDLRAILYREDDTITILYAAHHDPAYRWAERREIGRHPVTGAFQIVDTVETVREIEIIAEPAAPPLLAAHADDYLLSLGVPQTWLPTLRKVTDADQLLGVVEHLSPDVCDRLLALADGELVTPPVPVIDRPLREGSDPRRFYVVEDEALLAAALNAPFERWIAFLHPSQRRLVDAKFSGPAKVSGSAGTGKTVVAMHRARQLAHEGKRVLLTTYVKSLCANIEHNLRFLCSESERQQITVSTVHAQALALARSRIPRLQPATAKQIDEMLTSLSPRHAAGFEPEFVIAEWRHVIVPQGITSWADYRQAKRTGRGKSITVRERKTLWNLFDNLRQELRAGGRLDWAAICQTAVDALADDTAKRPFDAVIVDEVQDLSVPELRLVAALCADTPGNLMLCGDTGQRIYAGGFSLSRLGLDVRGRATILRINYRTTEQIRRAADRLIDEHSDDMDDGSESRKGTRSLLRGPEPTLAGYDSPQLEFEAAAAHIHGWLADGLKPEAIAVFARTKRQVEAIAKAFEQAELPVHVLSADDEARPAAISVGTMHRAKGLEFKAVLIAAVTDKLLPYHLVLTQAADPLDRERAVDNERRLLYVALTRARDEARITWHRSPSPLLAPLRDQSQ
jgi:hypothetical protein